MTRQDAPTRIQLLGVTVDEGVYALETGHVDEVVDAPPLSTVPHSDTAVAGVGRLRGEVVVFLDAGALVGARPVTPDTAVVLESDPDATTVGLLVDEVRRMRRADIERFRPAAEAGLDASVFAAAVTDEDGLLPVFGPRRMVGLADSV